MAALSIADCLKFANLQMAAEALYRFDSKKNSALLPGGTESYSTPEDIKGFLIAGNNHASKFAPTEAEAFSLQWIVSRTTATSLKPATIPTASSTAKPPTDLIKVQR